jgi:MurNAc alpha-1-phosphate uridylyltransferase
MMIDTALIFAAGRGERLRPFTLLQPKPMLELASRPLLSFHLESLAQAGFKRVIINHAYLGYKIKHYFGTGTSFNLNLEYLAEPPGGLETGGTLAAIAKWYEIDQKYLLCINGDIFTDYPWSTKLELSDNFHGKLILVPPDEHFDTMDFGLDSNRIIQLHHKKYLFSGIAYYRLSSLKTLNIGRYSIRNWLFQRAQHGELLGDIHNGLWFDIGTKERLLSLRKLYT